MPKRIQRKRTKGWRMPPNTVYVGRPSKFGNPFHSADAVARFRRLMREPWADRPAEQELLATLRGKNLACWCPLSQPCHADVLLELANADFLKLERLAQEKSNG